MKITPLVVSLIIPASVVLVCSLMQYFNDKKSLKMTKGNYCVSFHKGYLFLAVAYFAMITVVWVGVYSQEHFGPHNLWKKVLTDVTMTALTVVGIGAIIQILFHKTKVDGNKITVLRPFRKTFSCTFYDIASVKKRNPKNQYNIEKITVKTYSGKKFSVDNREIAYDRFVKSLCNKVTRSKLIGFEEISNFTRHK